MQRNFADISSNNPQVDIDAYHKAGFVVLAIKATEGKTFINPMHRGQALRCGLHHMVVIHYHFARPDLGNAPRDEAIHFLRTCHGLIGPRDYVVVDMERALGNDFHHDPAWSLAFDKTVQEFTRFHTILYANSSTLESNPGEWLAGDDRRVWDADFSTHPSFAPKGYTLAFRQFTDGQFGPEPHSAAGIGQCDMNHVADNKLWAQIVSNQPHG